MEPKSHRVLFVDFFTYCNYTLVCSIVTTTYGTTIV